MDLPRQLLDSERAHPPRGQLDSLAARREDLCRNERSADIRNLEFDE